MGNWSIPKPDEASTDAPSESFVWPPRRQADSAAETRAPSDGANRSQVQVMVKDPGLVRPKALRSVSKPLFDPTGVLAPRSRSVAAIVHNVERTWLDLTAAPLRDRIREEGWSPDASLDYCPSCGLSVEKDDVPLEAGETCEICRGSRPPWKRLIRLGEYRQPLSRWICEVKFTRWRRLGRDLGRVLGAQIAHEIEQARLRESLPLGPPLIVPIPTTFRRLIVRGIDHTLCIARGVADTTGGTIIQPLRREHRPSQTRVAPSQRAANISRAFRPGSAASIAKLPGRHVLVLDDVLTTGATLRAACRAVGMAAETKNGMCKGSDLPSPVIWAAVLGRTPPDAHDSSTDGRTSA